MLTCYLMVRPTSKGVWNLVMIQQSAFFPILGLVFVHTHILGALSV